VSIGAKTRTQYRIAPESCSKSTMRSFPTLILYGGMWLRWTSESHQRDARIGTLHICARAVESPDLDAAARDYGPDITTFG
jgi:hypothetical protein